MTIGLLSDTHLRRGGRGLPTELLRAFAEVDWILHAGDLNDLEVLEPLEALAPVVAVYGNTDPWETCDRLSETRQLELGGLRIGLAHGHTGRGRTTAERARSWFPEVEVVVFGHSHQPVIERVGEQLMINPGSPTDPRRAPSPSCALLSIVDGVAEARFVTWSAGP